MKIAAMRSGPGRCLLLGIFLLLVTLWMGVAGAGEVGQDSTATGQEDQTAGQDSTTTNPGGTGATEGQEGEGGASGGDKPRKPDETDKTEEPQESLEQQVVELRQEVLHLRQQTRLQFVLLFLALLLALAALLWASRGAWAPLVKGRRRESLPTVGDPQPNISPTEADATVAIAATAAALVTAPAATSSAPTGDPWRQGKEVAPLPRTPRRTAAAPSTRQAVEEPQARPVLEAPSPSTSPTGAKDAVAARSGGSQTSTEATLEALPHGAVAVALLRLHEARSGLAEGFHAIKHREATELLLGKRLAQALRQFHKQAQQEPETLRNKWVDHDLVAVLDGLAQLLSAAIEERRQGRGGRQRVEDALQQWLYDRLAPLCRGEGWFEIEPILPYATEFNPRIHVSVGSKPVDGAENLVVAVRSVGRRVPHNREMLHLAEVVVGC